MQTPSISEAEWEVMKVIWEHHPLTANDVVERLQNRRDWHPRTIKTMLGRLTRKGALTFREEGNRYIYSPRVERQPCIREASRSFIDQVFGGTQASALIHFVEACDLSRDEIEELKTILEKKKGKKL